MKSLCIKDNNDEVLNFINDKLIRSDLEDVFISRNEFKIYKNIIVHYLAGDISYFYDKLSSVLTDTIIHFYERKLLKRMLEYNYFYFNSFEKKSIIQIAEDFISSDALSRDDNYFSVYSAISDFINENKSLVLEGFVNFRLYNYTKNLDYIVDLAVNKYITDKEYLEFVNMLKLYISLTPPKEPLVHLICAKGNSILLDKNKKVIPMDEDSLNARYLSDISFSANDYALNTLLNLVPKKLIIHQVGTLRSRWY